MRARSIYRIQLTNMSGAERLVAKLHEAGYEASLYSGPSNALVSGQGEHQDHEAIWVGAEVPPSIVVDVIHVARDEWPFLKYVHLSVDHDETPDHLHAQMYLGGSTKSATTFLKCAPWSDRDFAELRPEMSEAELHACIRTRYSAP